MTITIAMIPEWDRYEPRVFKSGILYVTPEIEFDLMEDSDFNRFASEPSPRTFMLKGWEVKRYVTPPDGDSDPFGVLRALAWHKNFRQLDEWTYVNTETIDGEHRLFFNEVLAATATIGANKDRVHHAVLSAEIDRSSLDAEDFIPTLHKWIRELPR